MPDIHTQHVADPKHAIASGLAGNQGRDPHRAHHENKAPDLEGQRGLAMHQLAEQRLQAAQHRPPRPPHRTVMKAKAAPPPHELTADELNGQVLRNLNKIGIASSDMGVAMRGDTRDTAVAKVEVKSSPAVAARPPMPPSMG